MTTGERIKQRRKELGLTQEELAIRLGNKTRASVCTVEKDKEDLTLTRIRQYAKALETNPLYLMGIIDIPDENIEEYIKLLNPEAKVLLKKYHNATPAARSVADLELELHQQNS